MSNYNWIKTDEQLPENNTLIEVAEIPELEHTICQEKYRSEKGLSWPYWRHINYEKKYNDLLKKHDSLLNKIWKAIEDETLRPNH